MSWFSRMTTALTVGYSAFRESYFAAAQPTAEEWGTTAARRVRYAVLWATYESTVYRDIHRWATKLRADLNLYRYTRAIHNPAFRIGEFYATHTWGGRLDPMAGDGVAKPSAIPIVADNPDVRPAIATLWKASNLGQRKAIVPRWGATLGDVGLMVRDDPTRQRVQLIPVHPSTLRDVVRDEMGHVKAYVLEEERPDPRRGNPRLAVRPAAEKVDLVAYTEVVTRDGDDVVYQTYLDGAPYDWRVPASEQRSGEPMWREPYGFIPLVVIPHLDVGMEWGWSELQAGLPKFREIDDLASKLHDQIRKSVDPAWLFSGVSAPTTTPSTRQGAATTTNPQPGRDDYPALYGAVGADAKALVADVDIAGVGERIEKLVSELSRDYPEIDTGIWDLGASASGAARRAARARVEVRALERRAGYDTGLTRAMQMAVAIGGWRGYDGYAGFDLDSYQRGDLELSIGERPVFPPDPTDAAEIRKAFWEGIRLATESGVSLPDALRDAGWSEEKIATLETPSPPAMQVTGPPPRPDTTDQPSTPTPGGQPADDPQEQSA